ncbi:MAG: permease-like cell division protein FtsX [Methylococcaceae bacterium]
MKKIKQKKSIINAALFRGKNLLQVKKKPAFSHNTATNTHKSHPGRHDLPQTRVAGGHWTDKLKAYFALHRHDMFSSLARLVDAPFTSLLTIAVLATAIAFASGFYIVVANFKQLTGSLEATNQISLFLRDDVSESRANKLVESIKQNEDIAAVQLITKAQALKEFQNFSGFGAAINALESNPLPIVIQVQPKNASDSAQKIDGLLDKLGKTIEVDQVQVDMNWVKRLQTLFELISQAALLISIFLGLAVVLITANTIRLELHNRQEEISIIKLIGATNSFIRRPYLYTGLWFGFFSGVLAWFIVAIALLFIKYPIEKLSFLYDSDFHILFLSYSESLLMLILSSLMGILGAWIVLSYQLKQLNPK